MSKAPSPPAYLASMVTEETGCGRKKHPWVIEVQPGQRINLTMFDFASERGKTSFGNFQSECVVYIGVSEGEERPLTICAGGIRTRPAYISKSNRLQVFLTTPAETNGAYFMVKYEGTFSVGSNFHVKSLFCIMCTLEIIISK